MSKCRTIQEIRDAVVVPIKEHARCRHVTEDELRHLLAIAEARHRRAQAIEGIAKALGDSDENKALAGMVGSMSDEDEYDAARADGLFGELENANHN